MRGCRAVSWSRWLSFARRHSSLDRPGADPSAPDREFAGDQLAPMLGMGVGTASARLDLAETLAGSHTVRLAGVLDGMLSGQVSLAKAQILDQVTDGLDETLAAVVVHQVLEYVPEWSCGKLRHHLDRAVLAADPG